MSKATSGGSPVCGATYPELLLKNLRLLDLDEEFDWPNVTAATFAAADPAQNQRHRIFSAEWILFKLFELWEPKDTRDNLQVLFPPSEPKQSIILRAEFFRRLNDLKKDGVLCKEVYVRKTNFDDCKGPKFEELMAVFSSLVLLRLILQGNKDASHAKHLLAQASIEPAQAQLLVTAYQASLSTQLRTRETLDRRWLKFGRVLRAKHEELSDREHRIDEAAASNKERRIPRRTIDKLRGALEADWTGHAHWIDILLESDQHRPQNSLLERPYAQVWNRACDDTLYSIRPQRDESLLQSLEGRISQQNSRLDRWRSIQEGLKIGQHRISPQRMSRQASQQLSTPFKPLPQASDSGGSELWTDKERLEDIRSDQQQNLLTVDGLARPQPKFQGIGHRRGLSSSTPRSAKKADAATPAARHARGLSMTDDFTYTVKTPSALRPSLAPSRSADSNLDTMSGLAQDDEMVSAILSSVLNAEPSPMKQAPLLSLAERTRISMASMARTSPKKHSIDDLQLAPHPGSSDRAPLTPEQNETSKSRSAAYESLVERTRQSMSQMKRPDPLRRTSSKRVSKVYPTNQFVTPGKPPPSMLALEESVLEETLHGLGNDYDSVFKSRPRIAVSPVLQPTPIRDSFGRSYTLPAGMDGTVDGKKLPERLRNVGRDSEEEDDFS